MRNCLRQLSTKTDAWVQKSLTLHTAYAFYMGNAASLTKSHAIVRWLSKTADKQAKKALKSAMPSVMPDNNSFRTVLPAQISVQAHDRSKQGVSMHYALRKISRKQAVSQASCKISRMHSPFLSLPPPTCSCSCSRYDVRLWILCASKNFLMTYDGSK